MFDYEKYGKDDERKEIYNKKVFKINNI